MQPLLGPGDPPPFHRAQRDGQGAAAAALRSRQQGDPARRWAISASPRSELSRHIGWDIGGLDAAIELAKTLDAPLVASGYSRLVIDCNRWPGGEGSTPEISDGTVVVPANKGLTKEQVDAQGRVPASGRITTRSTASSTA